MNGADLGSTALAAATAEAQNVIDVFAESVAANIAFFLVIAAVLVACGVVVYIMKKLTHPAGGGSSRGRYASDMFPGMSRKMKAEWDWLDDHGMPR
jgi:hypothetical protein